MRYLAGTEFTLRASRLSPLLCLGGVMGIFDGITPTSAGQLAAFTALASLVYWSLYLAFALGPAKRVLAADIGIVEDEPHVSLPFRQPNRPRSELDGPSGLKRAESYRTRLGAYIEQVRVHFTQFAQAETGKLFGIALGTLVFSMLAAAMLFGFSDYLFGVALLTPASAEGVTGWPVVAAAVLDQPASFFGYAGSGDCRSPNQLYALTGGGSAVAIALKTIMTWSIPALGRQAWWCFITMPYEMSHILAALKGVHRLDDEALRVWLKARANEEAAGVLDGHDPSTPAQNSSGAFASSDALFVPAPPIVALSHA